MSKEYFQCPKCARKIDLNKRNITFGQRCYRCSVLMERVQEEAEPSTLVVEEEVIEEVVEDVPEEIEETVTEVGDGDVAESEAVEPEAIPEEVAPVETAEEFIEEEQPAIEEKVEEPAEAVEEPVEVVEEAEKVDTVSNDDKAVEAETAVEKPIDNLVGEVIEDPVEVEKIIEEAVSEEVVKITEIMEEE